MASWLPYDGENYLNWSETLQFCQDLAQSCPTWVTYQEIGSSREGRPILLLTIGRNDGRQDQRPGFWLDGGTHASEWTGVMSTLYTMSQWVNALRDGDAFETEYFQTHTIYVAPCISPDGFHALHEGHPFVRSGMRPPPNDQQIIGLEPQDVDGDGAVRWMRWKHPAGSFVCDPDVPMFMRPRTLSDAPEDAYFFCAEGLFMNWDGHRWVQAPRRFGLDLNRNFPAHWGPFSMFGMDGGTYPLSEPESRAVVDAFASRKRIGAGLTNHTYTGCILTQPYREDTPLSDADIRLFERLAQQAVEHTPYRVFRTVPDFSYDSKKAIVGVWSDTMSTTFGVPGYTLELWDPFGFAGIENDKPAEFFMRPDPIKIRKLIEAFSQLDGAVSPWTEFEHPQLGVVELGGIDYMRTVRNPPDQLLSKECKDGWTVADRLRRALPRTELTVSQTQLAPSLTRIEAQLDNLGFLSTASSERGKTLAGTPPVNVSITLSKHLALETGEPKITLPHLEGWGSIYPQGPHSVYPSLPNSGHRAVCTWVVCGSGDFRLEWSGGRGGMGVYEGQVQS